MNNEKGKTWLQREKTKTFRDCCSEQNAHLITLRQGSWAQSTELLPYFITTTKRLVRWFGMLLQNMLMSVLDMPKDIGQLSEQAFCRNTVISVLTCTGITAFLQSGTSQPIVIFDILFYQQIDRTNQLLFLP